MLFTTAGSPLQKDLMTARVANPRVQRPCRIGRVNLRKSTYQTKSSQKNQSSMHGKLSPGKVGISQHFCQIM
jgi:hypothetical protein